MRDHCKCSQCLFRPRWRCPWSPGSCLIPQECALHIDAAYEWPQHPRQLIIPPNTTQHMTTMLREQHASQLRIFREVIGVEQTLRQQIITAIEPQYLEAFWDTVTSWINLSVHNLIWNLYQLYGRVIPQKLQEQEDCIRQMVCDPVNPIDGIFTAIDELMHYANACGCAKYTSANRQHGVHTFKSNWYVLLLDFGEECKGAHSQDLDKLQDLFFAKHIISFVKPCTLWIITFVASKEMINMFTNIYIIHKYH